jgi:hypothetical protein
MCFTLTICIPKEGSVPKRTIIAAYDGSNAWETPSDGARECVPVADISPKGKYAKAILLPPASAVVWIEVEEVTPGILKRAPLPFIAPYVPPEYLDKFHAELWKYQATGRGILRAAYLLFDKSALKQVGETGVLTPWEIISECWGEGVYSIGDTVYRVVKDTNGEVSETRTVPLASAPSEWGTPEPLDLGELCRGAAGIPARRVGKAGVTVSWTRWLLAAGMLLLGLAILHMGVRKYDTAKQELQRLMETEASWSEHLTGRACGKGDLVMSVRRVLVVPEKDKSSVLQKMSLLDGALRRGGISARVKEIVVEESKATVRFEAELTTEDAAALQRAGLQPDASGEYNLVFRGDGR